MHISYIAGVVFCNVKVFLNMFVWCKRMQWNSQNHRVVYGFTVNVPPLFLVELSSASRRVCPGPRLNLCWRINQSERVLWCAAPGGHPINSVDQRTRSHLRLGHRRLENWKYCRIRLRRYWRNYSLEKKSKCHFRGFCCPTRWFTIFLMSCRYSL